MSLAYLDTSAFVKTIVREPETRRLELWLADRPERISSAILRTESVRATHPHGPAAVERARAGLQRIELVALSDELLDVAADLPQLLRSLDAIHVATAIALGSDLESVVTYDARMADAARQLGLDVVSP